jgi:predicted DNA-binding transcriptional regulator AlpA
MTQDLLTVNQTAALKGVTRGAIYAALKRGALPHQVVLGHIAVRRQDAEAWTAVGHKAGRPKGKPMSDEAKQRMSQSQKRRWQQRKSQ